MCTPKRSAPYQDSFHANVKCTECHMGRTGTIRSILLKASHFRHLPEVIFDSYDRPLESETMRPANESCELCHWPPAFHGDTVREITRFQPDEENTQERTYLILKTGAGTRERDWAMASTGTSPTRSSISPPTSTSRTSAGCGPPCPMAGLSSTTT